MTEPRNARHPTGMARTKAERFSLWICFLTALVATFSLYPGWLFFDSAKQWAWARQFVVNGWPSSLREYLITSHWPIFDTILKVPFYWLTHEAGFYILVQAFAFNVALFLVGRALIGRQSAWLAFFTVLMVLSPISINMSVFQSSDTIVAACALTAVAMIIDDDIAPGRRAFWIAIAVVLMSLIRYNALTAAIPLAVVFFWAVRGKCGSVRAGWLVAGILVATAFSVAAARAYEHTAYKHDSAPEGPALRMLEASRWTSDPVIHAIVDPHVQANPRLQQPLSPDCYVTGYWCPQIGGPWERLSTHRVMRAYLHLMMHHPLVFLRVNARFSWYALGLAGPLEARQLGRSDIDAPFPAARTVFNHRRFAMLSAFQAALGLFDGLAARAAVMFLLGLAASLCFWRARLVAGYVALSVGYAVPILLLASDTNFRYLFPITIVAMAIMAAACCVLARKILTGVHARGVRQKLRRAFTAWPKGRIWLSRVFRLRRNS